MAMLNNHPLNELNACLNDDWHRFLRMAWTYKIARLPEKKPPRSSMSRRQRHQLLHKEIMEKSIPSIVEKTWPLVGGLEHGFYFSTYIYIYWEFHGISSSQLTKSIIFQRGGERPNHETSTASSMFFSKNVELMDFGLAESDSDRNWPHAILPGWDLGSQNDASTGLRGSGSSLFFWGGVSHPPQPHWGRGVTALRRAS